MELGFPYACRICLISDESKCISLFESYKSSTVLEYVLSIANVNISQEDGYPTKICPNCLLELETAVHFKQRCEASDHILRESKLYPEIAIQHNPDLVEIKKEESLDVFDDHFNVAEEVDLGDFKYEVSLTAIKRSQLKCNICKQTFKSKNKLNSHHKNQHNKRIFTCDTCRRVFKSSLTYERHCGKDGPVCLTRISELPVRIEGVGKDRKYHCTHCNYVTDEIRNLKVHKVVHTKEKPYKCPFCPKAFTQSRAHRNHIEIAHENAQPSLPCHVCGKLLKTKSYLLQHVATHSEKRYQCDICKKIIKNKQGLKNHMVRHTGKKNFTCDVCAREFFVLSDLLNHKAMRHAAEKKDPHIQCPICGFKVRKNDQLQIHISKHGDNKHSCETCGRFFDSIQSLESHKKRHFDMHKCPYCPKYLIRRKHILTHVKRQHSAKLVEHLATYKFN